MVWELWRRRASIVWWSVGVAALIAVTLFAYKALGSNLQQLDKSFSSMSKSTGAFFGGTDFFSPVGYLSSQIYYITLPVMLIILTVTLASSLMSKDENDTSVELTLARGITRRRLLLGKALAGLVVVGVVCLLSGVVTAVMVHIANMSINTTYLVLTHLLTFAFALSFGMISFALIAANRLTKRFASVIAVLMAFGGYILSSMAGYVTWLHQPAKLMPYHYFDTAAMLQGHYSAGLLLYLLGVFVVGGVLASVGYRHRDIR
jgi:ABC-type transport system involved in multi-copper enzyme maturation permease subunit